MSDKKLQDQWPQALQFLAGGLKAGLSMEEAVEMLVQEAPDPLRSRLNSSRQTQSGWIPFEKRVERMFAGENLGLARAALLLAHETGGQVGPLLERAAQTLSMKTEMSERAWALTAQGRLSAWIVGATPLGILVTLSFFSPEYIRPLFQTAQGGAVLGLAALLIAVGLVLVHRLVKVEW